MKKSEYNDHHIHELLSKLPEIKDKRSRDEVYKGVAGNRPFRQRKIWLGPLVASFAALFILAVISPFWMQEFQSGSSGSEPKETAEDHAAGKSNDEAASGNRAPEKESKSMEERTTPPESQSPPKTAVPNRKEEKTPEKKPASPADLDVTFLASENEGNQSLVMAYSDSTVNYIIPVTLVADRESLQPDQYNQVHASFKEEGLGLTDYFQDTDIRPSKNPGHIEIHINENRKIISSSDALFADIIQESFSGKGYTSAELFTGESPGIDMGPLGELEELELIPSGEKAVYKYSQNSSRPLFALSNDTYESVSDAIKNMSQPPAGELQSVMTEGAKIESVEEKGNELILTFTESEYKNDEETIFMLEALLLTAKEFNFDTVIFQNINLDKVGTMEINSPVKVPFGPNPVPVNMK